MEHAWPNGTPERVVTDAFAALRDRDGARFADFATPPSVERYAGARRAAAMPRSPVDLAPDKLRALFPDVPTAVLDWQLSLQAQAATQAAQRLAEEFAGLTGGPEELDRLSAREVLARTVAATASLPYSGVRCAPLGHVLESAGAAHVLYRLVTILASDIDPHAAAPSVVTLLRGSEVGADVDGFGTARTAWRIVLDPTAPFGLPGLRHIHELTITTTRDVPGRGQRDTTR